MSNEWLSEIQTRELFDKLNYPNTVLLVKHYATVRYAPGNDNTPRNFLRDVIVNRHYACGNDFVPSDALPNLLFVVVLNDLSLMRWKEDEYSLFTVMHEDDSKRLRTNTKVIRRDCKMHPVMSEVNEIVYYVSDDEASLCFDIGDAFKRRVCRRPIRYYSAEECTDIIHTYLENSIPPFCDKVESLILVNERFGEEKHFVLDDKRLLKCFPNLSSICCNDAFALSGGEDNIVMLDPFTIGELCFNLARDGDIDMANYFTRELWALDRKWAKFFREVAVDLQSPREYRTRYYPDSEAGFTGLDKLFRIYLLGWYSEDSNFDKKVLLKKHKNLDKVIGVLKPRFKNRDIDEVEEKLWWDLKHIRNDEAFDLDDFEKVIRSTEVLFPGIGDMIKRK